jgi:hypothetical protein
MRGKSSPECALAAYCRQMAHMVRHGARTLAVSRVKRDGFSRLKRWPTALARRPCASADLPQEGLTTSPPPHVPAAVCRSTVVGR